MFMAGVDIVNNDTDVMLGDIQTLQSGNRGRLERHLLHNAVMMSIESAGIDFEATSHDTTS